MKKQMVNRVTLEGKLHSHDLAVKTVQNVNSENFGKEFIGGSVSIATDAEGINIVKVRYSYVAPTYASGKANNNYNTLMNIINHGKSITVDGMDAATTINLTPSIEVSDYEDRNGNAASSKTCAGGFVTIVSPAEMVYKNKYETDILINGVKVIEANPDRGTEQYVKVCGYIFNFRNEIFPAEFEVFNPTAINFFMGKLDTSMNNPIFSKIWGEVGSKTINIEKKEESAWGEPTITIIPRNIKTWAIGGMNPIPYELGLEETITADEIKTALANREISLAKQKSDREAYKATKAATPATATTAPAASGFGAAGDFTGF